MQAMMLINVVCNDNNTALIDTNSDHLPDEINLSTAGQQDTSRSNLAAIEKSFGRDAIGNKEGVLRNKHHRKKTLRTLEI